MDRKNITQEELDEEYKKLVFDLTMRGKEKIFLSTIRKYILKNSDLEREKKFIKFADENGLRVIF